MKRRQQTPPNTGGGYVPAGPPIEMISEEEKAESARLAGQIYNRLDDNSPELIRLWKETVARYRKADGPK